MQPSLFISHGSPMLALTPGPAHDFLKELGERYQPKAIVVVSAHWATRELAVSSSQGPETIHDFYGFPPALYQCRYPAPGAPELAARLADELGATLVERGLDHGAWVPLSLMYPGADIPVLSLSLPVTWPNQALVALGEKLAALRAEEVMILASGNLTHNLRALQPDGSPAPAWVLAFQRWIEAKLEAGDSEALLAWQKAPGALENHPTAEHFLPLLVAQGAGGKARLLHQSVSNGVLAMDCYAFD
ncbi:class III extradiol ring-cleavage dioxygenase [Gallaecimonas kandeliae]|uniref:dioxygenase family protein n=1 Tax=Gallaecimonas kandeliae TaxID=3029055 RepID=UPI00264A17F4|nr:class III extradiol ring-cleavage dioxygenase [Gallaecimonas kandeliae]WKE64108.1 class III extradiol ring-cleavage dioxygenase [Gallaecimonas kandeliae]